jgi:acyl carrier protein
MATDRPSIEQIERAIRDEIADRIEHRHGSRPIVRDELTLEALGIDSLGLHELVDRLETTLRVNPFEEVYSINDTKTVADLCRAYRAVCSDAVVAEAESDDPLVATRRRAEARRRRST